MELPKCSVSLAFRLLRKIDRFRRINECKKFSHASLPDEDEPPKSGKQVHDFRVVRGTYAVYGVGLATTGSLGVSSLIRNRTSSSVVGKPLRISALDSKKIKRVAAGFGFSLFASSTQLFGSGLNNFYQVGGFLRGGKTASESNPEWFIYPRKISLGDDFGKIIDVSSGRLHSLIATTSALFSLGDNSHGQCGQYPGDFPVVTHNSQNELRAIELPEKSPIRRVHCCLDTSFVLMENGNLYSFGLGTDGQLGNGNAEFQWKPVLVDGDCKGEKISRIAGSVDTLLAVSTSGDLFVWGQNEYGQLPGEDEPQVYYPRHFPLSNIGRIVCADATGSSCIICNERGEVYTWGSAVLGFGPKVENLDRPMQLDPPLFASSIGDEGNVTWVYAGNAMMAAVTVSGQLFTWGSNLHGNLALNHPNNQYFPCQVSLPEAVKHASFAPDHSIFVTK